MKRAKLLSLITGIVGLIYLIMSIVLAVLATAKLVSLTETIDPNNTKQFEQEAIDMITDSGGLLGGSILSIVLVVVLIVLGILTFISMLSLAKTADGRILGLIGGGMTAAGIIVGAVPVINYIYIAVAAILCIIASVKLKETHSPYSASSYM